MEKKRRKSEYEKQQHGEERGGETVHFIMREREREIEVLRSRIEEAGKERRKMECTKRTAAEKGS